MLKKKKSSLSLPSTEREGHTVNSIFTKTLPSTHLISYIIYILSLLKIFILRGICDLFSPVPVLHSTLAPEYLYTYAAKHCIHLVYFQGCSRLGLGFASFPASLQGF